MNAKRWMILSVITAALAAQASASAEGLFGRGPDVDLFGTYSTRDRYGTRDDQGGGGVGLDYFFTRYLGIGADSYLDEWKAPYRLNGSGIIRLPLQVKNFGLAPYGFGGGGREFQYVTQYSWHAGGGLEFKFNRQWGIFGDAREVWPDKTANYTLVRAGVSVGF